MNNKLKLLLVSASYKPSWIYGGPTYSVSALCEALVHQGVEVTVLTTNANGKQDLKIKNFTTNMIDGVKVIYCRRIVGDPVSISPAHTLALLKIIRQYDLVHINGWWNWVAIMSLAICKILRKPYVLSPRGSLSEYTFQLNHSKWIKKIIHTCILKYFINNSFIHVTSEIENEDCQNVVSNFRVADIPNILNIPPFFNYPPRNGGPFNIIFLGRIDPKKNLELLFRALAAMDFVYTLHIVGDGEPEYIDSLKGITSNNKNILWDGPCYNDEKYQLLGRSDLFVLLSYSENYGNAVIESLSQGTAVMISDKVGACEIVKKDHLGWVVKPELAACIDTLNKIHADPKALFDIRQRAPGILQNEMAPPTLARRYIDECYQAVLNVAKPNGTST